MGAKSNRVRRKRIRDAVGLLVLVVFLVAFILLLGEVKSLQGDLEFQHEELMTLYDDYDRVSAEAEELKKQNEGLQKELKERNEYITRLETLTVSTKEKVMRVAVAESNRGVRGQAAVLQTILTRSILWGADANTVVSAPAQYTRPFSGDLPDSVFVAWDLVYKDGYKVFSKETTHFVADGAYACWEDGKVCRGVAGGNRFYGEDD